MSVIVTNDDGIDSPYIGVLAGHLEEVLDTEVVVVAPEKQRSATSHTITLHKPLRVTERQPRRFAASGTPVDCVYLGLMKLAPRPVELVISGINDGHNLGTDVFYSGTVGGAAEGGLRGVPAIALSLAPRAGDLAERAASLAAHLARAVLADGLPGQTILNVNIPSPWDGRVRWTRLGQRHYEDDVHQRVDPRGGHYYWIGGGLAGSCESPGSDGEAMRDGIASITPLALNLSSTAMLGALPTWDLGEFELG
jgi:5'-nucleotidase